MVKFFLSLIFVSVVAFGTDLNITSAENNSTDLLDLKIKSFISESSYNKNKRFIDIIFDPKSDFYISQRVDSIKVIQTLKENGLLKLFFAKPTEFQLNFKTNSSPIFFIKIMDDTLRNIGYYRYTTLSSSKDASQFTWSIKLRSEYATDPIILQKELTKQNCNIIDVIKNSKYNWTYIIDISQAKLNVALLKPDQQIELKRSLYAYWLNVSKIRELNIKSSFRNRWYPYVVFYDSSLHIVKIIKRDRITKHIKLTIPKNATYMKLSDIYTLKNIRRSLSLLPKGSR